MRIAMIKDANAIHGKEQGYLPLPVRHYKLPDGTPCMLTAWTPTPEEIAALVAGANIIVNLLGSVPPPMMLSVGQVPA